MGSFLCIALNLSCMIKEFESLKYARDTQTFTAEMLEDDIKLNTTDGESEEKLIASWSKTVRIPEFILALECLDNMQSRLLGVMQLTIDKLATSLPINAILFMGAPGSVDLSSTLPANLGLFYNREMMQESIKQVTKVFCVTAKKEYTWPAEGLLDMIRQLSSVWPAECFDVALAKFAIHDHDDLTMAHRCTSTADMHKALHMATAVSQLAMALAWIEVKLSSPDGEACLRENKLKAEIELAISWARSTVLSELDWMHGITEDDIKHLNSYCLAIPAAKCVLWLRGLKAVLSQLCRATVKVAVAGTSALAVDVEKHTPRYSHIVSNDSINMSLARKHLLGWASREALSETSIRMFHCIAGCSRIYTQWALGTVLEDDAEFCDEVKSNQLILDVAKAAITTIAAISVIAEMSGEAQKSDAAKLVSTSSPMLVKSLLKRLQGISGVKAEEPSHSKAVSACCVVIGERCAAE